MQTCTRIAHEGTMLPALLRSQHTQKAATARHACSLHFTSMTYD
jgi:hypothetical protein